MHTLYLWKYIDLSHVGHISLQLHPDLMYISHWPAHEDPSKRTQKAQLWTKVTAEKKQTLENDIDMEEREPDARLDIPVALLNAPQMAYWWENSGRSRRYNFAFKNCAHAVCEAVQRGLNYPKWRDEFSLSETFKLPENVFNTMRRIVWQLHATTVNLTALAVTLALPPCHQGDPGSNDGSQDDGSDDCNSEDGGTTQIDLSTISIPPLMQQFVTAFLETVEKSPDLAPEKRRLPKCEQKIRESFLFSSKFVTSIAKNRQRPSSTQPRDAASAGGGVSCLLSLYSDVQSKLDRYEASVLTNLKTNLLRKLDAEGLAEDQMWKFKLVQSAHTHFHIYENSMNRIWTSYNDRSNEPAVKEMAVQLAHLFLTQWSREGEIDYNLCNCIAYGTDKRLVEVEKHFIYVPVQVKKRKLNWWNCLQQVNRINPVYISLHKIHLDAIPVFTHQDKFLIRTTDYVSHLKNQCGEPEFKHLRRPFKGELNLLIENQANSTDKEKSTMFAELPEKYWPAKNDPEPLDPKISLLKVLRLLIKEELQVLFKLIKIDQEMMALSHQKFHDVCRYWPTAWSLLNTIIHLNQEAIDTELCQQLYRTLGQDGEGIDDNRIEESLKILEKMEFLQSTTVNGTEPNCSESSSLGGPKLFQVVPEVQQCLKMHQKEDPTILIDVSNMLRDMLLRLSTSPVSSEDSGGSECHSKLFAHVKSVYAAIMDNGWPEESVQNSVYFVISIIFLNHPKITPDEANQMLSQIEGRVCDESTAKKKRKNPHLIEQLVIRETACYVKELRECSTNFRFLLEILLFPKQFPEEFFSPKNQHHVDYLLTLLYQHIENANVGPSVTTIVDENESAEEKEKPFLGHLLPHDKDNKDGLYEFVLMAHILSKVHDTNMARSWLIKLRPHFDHWDDNMDNRDMGFFSRFRESLELFKKQQERAGANEVDYEGDRAKGILFEKVAINILEKLAKEDQQLPKIEEDQTRVETIHRQLFKILFTIHLMVAWLHGWGPRMFTPYVLPPWMDWVLTLDDFTWACVLGLVETLKIFKIVEQGKLLRTRRLAIGSFVTTGVVFTCIVILLQDKVWSIWIDLDRTILTSIQVVYLLVELCLLWIILGPQTTGRNSRCFCLLDNQTDRPDGGPVRGISFYAILTGTVFMVSFATRVINVRYDTSKKFYDDNSKVFGNLFKHVYSDYFYYVHVFFAGLILSILFVGFFLKMLPGCCGCSPRGTAHKTNSAPATAFV